jgi:hypothetical protein
VVVAVAECLTAARNVCNLSPFDNTTRGFALMALTKSLHTVTAVANVARYVVTVVPVTHPHTLAHIALDVLGYSIDDYPPTDPTVQKILRECSRIVGARVRVAA